MVKVSVSASFRFKCSRLCQQNYIKLVVMTHLNQVFRVRLYNWNSNSHNKSVPLQAWSGPEGSRKLRFPDFVTTAQDGGKVVSLTHRPPLPQEMLLILISVRGWVDHRAIVRSEGFYVNEKFQWHHLGSNQRPSDLWHSTLTTVLPRSPK